MRQINKNAITLSQLSAYLSAISVCAATAAHAQTPERDINEQVRSGANGAYIRNLGATYNFADRSSGDIESTSSGVSLTYSHNYAQGYRKFVIVSGLHDDFDAPLSNTTNRGASVSYGVSRAIANGLQFTAAGFLSYNYSDVEEAAPLDISSRTAGLVLALRQTIPLSSNVFAAVRGSVAPRFTHRAQLGNHYDAVAYTFTPGADLYYKVNDRMFLGTGFETSMSNQDLTLSRKNQLYRGGVGAMYKMDDYSLTLDYKRELATRHHGNLFSFSVSRNF